MRRAAGFHSDKAGSELGEEPKDLVTLQLLAQDAPALRIGCVNLKNLLGKVQTDYANLFHGWLPSFVSYMTPLLAHRCRGREPSTPSSRKGALRALSGIWSKSESEYSSRPRISANALSGVTTEY